MKGSIELGSEDECNYCQSANSDVMYTDLELDGIDSQEVTYLYLCSDCDSDDIVPDSFSFKMSLHEGGYISSLK